MHHNTQSSLALPINPQDFNENHKKLILAEYIKAPHVKSEKDRKNHFRKLSQNKQLYVAACYKMMKGGESIEKSTLYAYYVAFKTDNVTKALIRQRSMSLFFRPEIEYHLRGYAVNDLQRANAAKGFISEIEAEKTQNNPTNYDQEALQNAYAASEPVLDRDGLARQIEAAYQMALIDKSPASMLKAIAMKSRLIGLHLDGTSNQTAIKAGNQKYTQDPDLKSGKSAADFLDQDQIDIALEDETDRLRLLMETDSAAGETLDKIKSTPPPPPPPPARQE